MKVIIKYENVKRDCQIELIELDIDKVTIENYNDCGYISFQKNGVEVFEIGKLTEHMTTLEDCGIDLKKLLNEIINNFINTGKIMSLLNNMESFNDIYKD